MFLLRLTAIALVLGLACAAAQAQSLRATTQDGREVLLDPKGTWKFAPAAVGKGPDAGAQYRVPAASKENVQIPKLKAKIAYNDKRWQLLNKPLNEVASLSFRHVSGDSYAMVIAERVEMPIKTLRDAAVENARAAAQDLKVEREERRTVNGKSVLFLQMSGTVKGIPFVYYNYYHAGPVGSIQIISYTSKNLFEENKADFADLLNGLLIE